MDYGLKRKAFTLAEALITLVLIGVIAAMTIPAILVNTEQHEYKTGLKKAVSALNQVIEMNMALEGYGPIEIESGNMSTAEMGTRDDSIYNFFRKRMNVISTSSSYNGGSQEAPNWAFFTADGMRYEFPTDPNERIKGGGAKWNTSNSKCARSGANIQDDLGNTMDLPCLVIVDVNGERRPNPNKNRNSYKVPGVQGTSKILDVFPIVITDVNATPFGIVGQRALFQHK